MKKLFSITKCFSALRRVNCSIFAALGRFLGYDGPKSLFRVSGRVIALCLSAILFIFTIYMVLQLSEEVYDELLYRYRASRYWRTEEQLSPRIAYQRNYYKREGRIMDMVENKCLVSDVDWVTLADDGDSLTVFAKGGYRGFINRFTGEVIVQPTAYRHAWMLSEGLAAVVKEGRLLFIDHKGHVVIETDIMADFGQTSYLFHHGYCLVESQQHPNRWGLLDKQGKWAVKPEYNKII